MKTIAAIIGLAASAVFGVIHLADHRAPPPAVAAEPSTQPPAGMSSPCANGPLIQEPWYVEWQSLLRSTEAKGGLEMGSAGFHPTPRNAGHQISVWNVAFHRYADGSLFTNDFGAMTMPVLLNQEETVRRAVQSVATVPNAIDGGFDVVVTFSATLLPYVQRRQQMVDAQDPTMLFSAVSLVHDNRSYSTHGYGEIASAIQQNNGQVRVARGVTQAVATAISAALQ